MDRGNEEQGSKFITTEPLKTSGEAGEQKVWDATKSAFYDRICIGYWRYPIFSKVGEIRKEPDILIADREFGLVVIEVKSVTIEQIISIEGENWQFQNFDTTESNPYQQAEHQLRALIGYSDREPAIQHKVNAKAIVALPLITQEQWQQKGFDKLPSCPPIIFQDQLGKVGLLERIQQSPFERYVYFMLSSLKPKAIVIRESKIVHKSLIRHFNSRFFHNNSR